MPTFNVTWSKAYYRNGTTEIEADDIDAAYLKADDEIGNWEGSLQYYPDDNQIYVEDDDFL
jgi:hypothetical protein